MLGELGLDQRDRAPERRPVTGEDAGFERVDVDRAWH